MPSVARTLGLVTLGTFNERQGDQLLLRGDLTVTGKLARNVSVYGDASYLSQVSGESRITLKGNVGARVTW